MADINYYANRLQKKALQAELEQQRKAKQPEKEGGLFADLLLAVVDGVVSIPIDITYGVKRTYEDIGGAGEQVKEGNSEERKRLLRTLQNALSFAASESGPISKIVRIILTEFYDLLPDSAIEKVATEAGVQTTFMASRYAAQAALTALIANKLAEKIVTLAKARRLTKFAVGSVLTALLIQGLIERASQAGKRLKMKNPKIHHQLVGMDLDMAYFLVEDVMQPILDAINVLKKDKTQLDRLVDEIEKKFLE